MDIEDFSLSERNDSVRDFSWNVFAVTGNVEAYLLYRECTGSDCDDHDDNYEDEDQEVSVN